MWITKITTILTGIILLIEAVTDWKKKKVHITGAVLIGVCAIVNMLSQHDFSGTACLMGAGTGICLLVLSILTEEKIGKGDGIYFIALGVFLGFEKMMLLSVLAFSMAAVCSIGMLILKKANRHTRIPFLPFVGAAYGICSVCGMVI